MRVYRNRDGYIVTYVPDDVVLAHTSEEWTHGELLATEGFFRYDRNGNLQDMDNHQPEGRALAAFAVHCRDFAEGEQSGDYHIERLEGTVLRKESVEELISMGYEPHLLDNPNALPPQHDIGGEG